MEEESSKKDEVVNVAVVSNENIAVSNTVIFQEPTGNSNISYGNSDTDSDQDAYQAIPLQPLRQKLVQTPTGVQVIYENDVSVIGAGGNSIGMTESGDGMMYDGQVHSCVICGDRGSGYHYSVLSCEGCKGFFKRTVQKNLIYVCKANGTGTCEINKMTRNNCQACRFEKCLLCGMKREAVREDRSPGGKHRIKRPRMEGDDYDPVEKDADPMTIETQLNDIINVLVGSQPDRIPQVVERKTEGISIDELMSYGYVELRFIIEWAKKVPNFRTFTMDDQMALLKSAFMELNVLRLSYRSMHLEDSLQFAEGLVLHKDVCQTMGWGNELVHATLEFAIRLRELNIDHVEFALMNAIVLTYPDAIGIVEKMKVTNIQTKFLDVLRKYISSKYSHDKGRFGKILLRLPTLRTLSAKAAERFLSLTLDGVLPLNDLVQEMMA